LIDHEWNSVGYEFFKVQFWIFLVFFCFPFAVDIYFFPMVLKNYVMTPTHFIFNLIALGCQFAFFINELVQMAAKKRRITEYFDGIWNLNDIMLFPTYLTL